ncbi:hypothetical protein scyTo_0019776 [Scyliorhinus torazame]|uniref:Uncharacterized protein n=1 Tax=Scyliorhinus torazame TaxID=75743 RepID=A0A401PQX2_SCYTO|nr:hypothetical protein [Scyliorhinus torazame]
MTYQFVTERDKYATLSYKLSGIKESRDYGCDPSTQLLVHKVNLAEDPSRIAAQMKAQSKDSTNYWKRGNPLRRNSHFTLTEQLQHVDGAIVIHGFRYGTGGQELVVERQVGPGGSCGHCHVCCNVPDSSLIRLHLWILFKAKVSSQVHINCRKH